MIKKLETIRSAWLPCDNDQSVKVIESVLDFSHSCSRSPVVSMRR